MLLNHWHRHTLITAAHVTYKAPHADTDTDRHAYIQTEPQRDSNACSSCSRLLPKMKTTNVVILQYFSNLPLLYVHKIIAKNCCKIQKCVLISVSSRFKSTIMYFTYYIPENRKLHHVKLATKVGNTEAEAALRSKQNRTNIGHAVQKLTVWFNRIKEIYLQHSRSACLLLLS